MEKHINNYLLEKIVDINGDLIGSRLPNGLHIPLFDFDFPVYLLQSKTPGHYHCYLDQPITFTAYDNILKAFEEAGIIQNLWRKNLEISQQTYLRIPNLLINTMHTRYRDKPNE